jgi:hypothetical protein
VVVYVKLPHYGLYRRAVILYHVRPPLGIQHCPYPQCTFIELLYGGSPLGDDLVPMVVAEVSAPDLILPKMGVVVYQLGILLICGGTSLSDWLTRDWPVSGSFVTLHVLHHDLKLGLEVLSLL